MPSTLPILLKDQKVLLIGGGNVALQKAEVLADNEIKFRVISQEINSAIEKLTDKLIQKEFKLKDIGEEYIIIDATGNPKVTKKLLKYKKKHQILLNVVDQPKYCDFYFMALTKNRPLQIAVSSNGASPTAAKYFRDQCEAMIPEDITAYLVQKQKERDHGLICIQDTIKELKFKSSKVYLVGCGIGDPELLTLKAYKIIQNVDVVLYDHLISNDIMALVPKHTLKVFVGKQKGYHSKSQDEINALILHYASQGKKIARLKSGDPFVFGRGAEELMVLTQQHIDTEVIPGISSSISAPLMGNIPVTARGYASGFTVVSAHLRGNRINLDWIDLLAKENHTVVVLMGLSRIKEIVDEAIKLGISSHKPCAVISNASRPDQKILTTTIEHLQRDAEDMPRPAIIVFGDVVTFKTQLTGVENEQIAASF
ncbi:uroporphyrinogen-III C-methyltransferase [Sulfurovum sp. zt1-1]|uniref:Uroporphyrinogen-III C-methyltransferase n=1 Tax=Sulfurovum zhangzhouensis TaxID=3019067 RepID=A0ABT7QUV1_9BACT|nr:uroporphyrinogen-III C-methyltransferase [Sulfurovum zhangzhouensis]MDM5270608.1 uroporphyrinogen-III C-methyltransferase [Sulfurovum zhangzhouensis]